MRILLFVLFVYLNTIANSQVFCVQCFNQVPKLNPNASNLIVNGSFESNSCDIDNELASFNPASIYYSCNLDGWMCYGGGVETRSCVIDTFFNTVPDGNAIVYLGSSICKACSDAPNDISCVNFSDCRLPALPPGYPLNSESFGGPNGVVLEQTVSGLIKGNAYTLEFWAGGECFFSDKGLFAVNIGFGDILLTCEESCPSSYSALNGKRYMISFIAQAASHTIKFISWGHICSTCTQLCLDDVILYPLLQADSVTVECFIPCSADIEEIASNVFTPNNDGINDLFFPFLNLSYPFQDFNFTSYNLQVFDRWGNKQFETSELSKKGWNGITSANKIADAGVYYWIFKATTNCEDGKIEKKGFFNLLR